MLICELQHLDDGIDIGGCYPAQHLIGDDQRLEWEEVGLLIHIRSDGASQ